MRKLEKKGSKSWIDNIFFYLKKHKKFWLLPMIIIFVLFAVLIILAETAPIVSPFIYTIF